eukprot:g4310.t1
MYLLVIAFVEVDRKETCIKKVQGVVHTKTLSVQHERRYATEMSLSPTSAKEKGRHSRYCHTVLGSAKLNSSIWAHHEHDSVKKDEKIMDAPDCLSIGEGDDDLSGFRNNFQHIYELYRNQLDDHNWDEETKNLMADLGEIHRLFSKRLIVEDTLAALALFVIFLSFALDFDMLRWEEKHPDKLYSDTWIATLIKGLTLIDSVFIIILLTKRARIIIRKKVLQNAYPRNTGLFVHPARDELRHWCFECFISALHVPMGCNFYLKFDGMHTHINIFNVVVLLRLYMLLRVMRNHSGFYGPHIHFIAHMNGVDSLSIPFNFKMLLKYNPVKILTPLLLVNWFATGIALVVLERPSDESNINNVWDGIYCAMITMSTVGYGDYVPFTTLGRITVVIGGICGGTILSTMLVAVFVETSETSEREDYVINIKESGDYKRHLKDVAAVCAQQVYRFRGLRKKAEAGDSEAVKRFPKMYRRMYHAMDALRATRKSKPDTTTKKERRDVITDGLKRTLALLYGSSDMTEVYHLKPEWKNLSAEVGEARNSEQVGSVRYQIEQIKKRQILLKEELVRIRDLFYELDKGI